MSDTTCFFSSQLFTVYYSLDFVCVLNFHKDGFSKRPTLLSAWALESTGDGEQCEEQVASEEC